MKIALLLGDQLRHLYFARQVLELYPHSHVIIMNREDMIPEPPAGTALRDATLFRKHFNLRQESERRSFGTLTRQDLMRNAPSELISEDQLNSVELAKKLEHLKPDVCVVFGTNLIKDPVLSVLPNLTFNVHLGLSPWYRGSATLFWPFYFMEPQWAGVTVHRITKEVDAGSIAFQKLPVLTKGMGIHDAACAVVSGATNELLQMLKVIESGKEMQLSKQTSTGRIFRVRDFRPVHLRVNYELFNDRMIDSWLAGDLIGTTPKTVQMAYE